MPRIAAWLFLLPGFVQGPLDGPPTVLFVPNWARHWVSLPEGDFACSLDSVGRYSDALGHWAEVEHLLDGVEEHPDGSPVVVRVCVNSNAFSPRDVQETVRRIRAGWDHRDNRKRIIIVFQFAPEVTVY